MASTAAQALERFERASNDDLARKFFHEGQTPRLRRHDTFLYITQTTTPITTTAPARIIRNVCVSNAMRRPFVAVRSMRPLRPFA